MKIADTITLIGIALIAILFIVGSVAGSRRRNLIVLGISGSILLASGFLFTYRPSTPTQILSGFFLGILFVTFLIAFFKGAIQILEDGFGGMIPAVMALLILIASFYTPRLGHAYRDYVFRKNLPRYQELVEVVKQQPLPLQWRKTDIPEKYRDLTDFIYAQNEPYDQWSASFGWGGGFPVKHCAFLYISGKDINRCSEHLKAYWPHREKICDHWYRVGD